VEALTSELAAAQKALTMAHAQIVRKGFVAGKQLACMQDEARERTRALQAEVRANCCRVGVMISRRTVLLVTRTT
jgi:hypothetical protein